jgi:hypothetical protein
MDAIGAEQSEGGGMYLDAAMALFSEREAIPPEDVHGFTEEEVLHLEQELGQALPAAYKEFLLWMGHGAKGFMVGDLMYFPRIPGYAEAPWDLTKEAHKLLDESAFPEPLPVDAFVFSMHEGYQFWFFRFTEGDDPPVYGFGDGQTKDHFDVIDGTFSEFMLRTVDDDIRAKQQLEEWRRRAEERR